MNRFALLGLCFAFQILCFSQTLPRNRDYYASAYRYYLDAKNDSALVYLDLALTHPVDSNDHQKKIETLLLKSRVLGNLTFFESAMEHALEAYDLSKKEQLESLVVTSLLDIGKIHFLMYNDSVAEQYLLRAKELAVAKGYEKELMMTQSALAQLYCVNEKSEKALDLMTKSLEMAKQQQDTIYIIQNLNLFASYYTNLNRWANIINPEYQRETKQYLDEASRLASASNIPMLILPMYIRYLRYYRVEKNYHEALNYANKVLDMCEPTHYTMLIQVYDHLVGIYAHLGDENRVIDSHQKFYNLMRKQSDYTLHRSLQEMQVKYDVKEKELEIVRQQHEIENHKARRRLYASGILALTLIVLLMTYILRLKSKRNRELAANNAVKDKLFSIISHDLKSPAVAQKMAVDSMIEELETRGESQSLTERLKAFRDATESQLSLLMNLLNWSSLQTGRMAYTPIAFSILETVHKAVDLYRVPAQNKNLNLVIDIPDDCMVVADKQMINTVVRNLLSNAVKFSLPDNEISISVTCHEQSACVRIIDHGIGMSPQQIRNLLESGKNISKSGTHGEKGSGLGLIICKELLEKNGSQLHISGDGQKGTDVWFYLPKA